ncbi:S1 family peptidase [Rhodococcus opacus]|uniref:S1 family peptidase n=1 Tax=Rhodococcus opacus TaxID=37919 RepID=UPI001F58E63F|nr:serine protease [Rhodococcus opacus]UNN05266.1 serine protease [Rhodococcus opacus]
MVVPSQCYLRTLKIKTPTGLGTCFTINRHGRQWLVTAQHVLEGVNPVDIKVVTHDGVEQAGLPLQLVPPVNPGADIAVLSLNGNELTHDLSLLPSSEGCVITQDAYFLGFPFGLSFQNAFETLPIVKKSIVSGNDRSNSVLLWLLDGINNPGFSGGPVVFNRLGTDDWQVLGVVSGYRTQAVAVADGAGHVPTNSGIILAYGINHAVESIDQFVRSLGTNPAA